MNEEEIVKLKEENEQLKAKLARAENEVRLLRRKSEQSLIHFNVQDFCFQSSPKPKLIIKQGDDKHYIYFESSNDKAAVLAQVLCEDSERIHKMLTDVVAFDELYEWLERGNWFKIESKDRKQFKQEIYQGFRRLNDKIAKKLNGKVIFKNVDGGYTIPPLV